MSKYYRKIAKGTEPPATGRLGDLYRQNVGDIYQLWIWLGLWVMGEAGGVVVDETGMDDVYYNVIVQEEPPFATAKLTDIWIQPSTKQAYRYAGGSEFQPYAAGII